MSFTLTYAWWWIPTAFTVFGILWAMFAVEVGDGWFAGLANLFALLAVLAVSAPMWIIAAVLKT